MLFIYFLPGLNLFLCLKLPVIFDSWILTAWCNSNSICTMLKELFLLSSPPLLLSRWKNKTKSEHNCFHSWFQCFFYCNPHFSNDSDSESLNYLQHLHNWWIPVIRFRILLLNSCWPPSTFLHPFNLHCQCIYSGKFSHYLFRNYVCMYVCINVKCIDRSDLKADMLMTQEEPVSTWVWGQQKTDV